MKTRCAVLIVVSVVMGLGSESAAEAATYYVATTGNDGNPGTQASPWRTIQKAADTVNPGDTVLVNDGVYTGNRDCGGSTAVVCAQRGGTSANWVTFKSLNKWGAKLNGQSNTVALGFSELGASFVEFRDFEIYGLSGAGFAFNNAGTSDYRIIGNHIHDIGRYCTNTPSGLSGIYTSRINTWIEGNLIHDIGRYVLGENGCAIDFPPNHDHGIYPEAAGGNGLRVLNNIFYNIKRGWAVNPGPGAVTDMIIANNTFYGPNPGREGHILFFGMSSVSNLQIKNNIFHTPNTAAIYFYDGTYSNTTVQNNLVYGATLILDSSSGGYTSSGNTTADPLFVDTAGKNFHLSPSSPAVNAGAFMSTVSKDFDGLTRSNPPEIGAYESGATTTRAPAQPTNLRIISQ